MLRVKLIKKQGEQLRIQKEQSDMKGMTAEEKQCPKMGWRCKQSGGKVEDRKGTEWN